MCASRKFSGAFRTVCVIYLLVKVVMALDNNLVRELPLNGDVLTIIAEEICYNFNLENEKCQRNFIEPASYLKDNDSETKVVCRDKESVTLAVVPSTTQFRIIVLVPNNTNQPPIHTILYPNENHTTISVSSSTYEVYTTPMSVTGDRGMWRVGPEVMNWQTRDMADLSINLENFIQTGDDWENAVQASFSWNSSIFECGFDVTNDCDSKSLGNYFDKHIGFGMDTFVTIAHLPLGDKCTIEVRSSIRRSSLTYRTPDCYRRDGDDVCRPEYTTNVSILTREAASGDGWDITVRWDKPLHQPRKYNLTLIAHDNEYNIIATGNKNEVKFEKVEGAGMFSVTIMAVYPVHSSIVTRKSIFPAPPMSPRGIMAGASACALLLSLTVTALLYARRKLRDRRVQLYFPALDEKIVEDEDAGWVSLGPEDGWELRPDRLMLHHVLGEGAFGVVRKATLAPEGKEVAVKMLKDYPSIEEVRAFRSEMDLMKSVGGHAHVVSLVGCCSGRRPCIVAEYCSRADLLQYLRCAWDILVTKRNAKYNNNIEYSADYRDSFKETNLFVNKLYDLQGICDSELTPIDLLSFCRQIAMGMEFLASNRVVHRDLAARNVLVCADKTLKIADFGLSRDVYQDNLYKQSGNGKLPIKWMAIESLTHRLYTSQSDVWSFGVVMWEVVTVGGSPYPSVAAGRLARLLRAGYRMPRPNHCAQIIYEVMLSCWNSRPRERPTFSELHARLDSILHSAAAPDYLTLHIDYEDLKDIKQSKYKELLARNKLTRWAAGKDYKPAEKIAPSNHYTKYPDIVRTQVV